MVNKLDAIDNKFRFFKMELIAGEPNYVVQHVRIPSLDILAILDIRSARIRLQFYLQLHRGVLEFAAAYRT